MLDVNKRIQEALINAKGLPQYVDFPISESEISEFTKYLSTTFRTPVDPREIERSLRSGNLIFGSNLRLKVI